jgi:isoleucyl-tRNA synthetase
VAERPILDRWILAELHALTGAVDGRMEVYDTPRAGRLLSEFIDDLSNWYVRRSRKRFWDGEPDALVTLHECLDVLTRLLAPFAPFITEEVWQQVIRRGSEIAPESVHLATWPQPETRLIDSGLSAQVATARALAEAGRSARKAGNVRIRQPLSRALIGLPAATELPQSLLDDVSDELNVKLMQSLDAGSEITSVHVKPNFSELGKRLEKRTQRAANAILAADPRALATSIRRTGTFHLPVDGEEIVIGAADVFITEVPRTGWVVESQRGVTIAIDTRITPELEAEGTARDVIRVVQRARREADLDVSDRIVLSIAAPPQTLAVIRSHQEFIAHETLAVSVALVDTMPEGFTGSVGVGGEITVAVVRASAGR